MLVLNEIGKRNRGATLDSSSLLVPGAGIRQRVMILHRDDGRP